MAQYVLYYMSLGIYNLVTPEILFMHIYIAFIDIQIII